MIAIADLNYNTSGGSGFSDSGLPELAPDADWLAGRRLNGASRADVEEWVAGLDLPKQEKNTMKKITLSFNGHTYSATLEDNSSEKAFADLLKSGPLTVSTHDYGSFEKAVGMWRSPFSWRIMRGIPALLTLPLDRSP